MSNEYAPVGYADADGMEEVDEWRCAPGCPIAALDSQAGERKGGKAVRTRSGGNTFGGNKPKPPLPDMEYNDGSHVSRFFPVFAYEQDDFVPWLYCAKASRREREAGLTEGPNRGAANGVSVRNAHPT
jgi:hypothetical protein